TRAADNRLKVVRGLDAWPEKRTPYPAVGGRGLAEVRDVPLDAGQVLEVGGRCEEEEVDSVRLHRLAHPPSSFGVVEHRASLFRYLRYAARSFSFHAGSSEGSRWTRSPPRGGGTAIA